MWGIDAAERHRDALAAGDLVLIYLGAPERKFIGRAELASAVHDWTQAKARVYQGKSRGGVLLGSGRGMGAAGTDEHGAGTYGSGGQGEG
jgi:hypothetical protein